MGARTETGSVLADLARTLGKIYGRQGIEVQAEIEPGLVFRGERQDLEEMVGNLMDNACKWAESDVKVSSRRAGERELEIRIEDNGPGLTDEQAKAALKRGVRLDEKAPGSGLGLSIVTDLARAYEGEVEFSRSEMGGLLASVKLPATSR